MKKILLIYPYFKPEYDRSVFRFPPLGIAYLASKLRREGHEVSVLDCTFMSRPEALEKAVLYGAGIVGIYAMATMRADCVYFAGHLRNSASLLVAGGPLASTEPEFFLDYFDVVVRGEGEQTMAELAGAYRSGKDIYRVPGIAFRDGTVRFSKNRGLERDLDSLPLPARDLLPNGDYIRYGKKRYGYSITSVMTTRGCPFECEFSATRCSGSHTGSAPYPGFWTRWSRRFRWAMTAYTLPTMFLP